MIVYQQVVWIGPCQLVALAWVFLFWQRDCGWALTIRSNMFPESELEMMDDTRNTLVLLDHFLVMGLDLNGSPCHH